MNAYTTIVAATPPAGATTTHATAARTQTQRHDGWTPERRRAFLEHIADGDSVTHACERVHLTPRSAYNLRRRADGADFAIGWQGANLIARDCVAETLTDRALAGFEETVTRADGTVIVRHRFDNRLAHAMLTRLDRQADAAEAKGRSRAAQMVAGDFEAFLDGIGSGAGPGHAERFLAQRGLDDAADPALDTRAALVRADRYHRTGAALAEDVPVDDLDPAGRARWTADQWQRADAAGMLAFTAPDGADAADDETAPEWEDRELARHQSRLWSDDAGEWRTDLPPPADFDGDENGDYGDEDYSRDLTVRELTVVRDDLVEELADLRASDIAAYPHVFGFDFPAEEDDADDAPSVPEDISDLLPPPCAPSGVEGGPPHSRSIPMADTSHDIRTLNGLIATTLDSVDGYTEAAKDADSDRFGTMFTQRAEERRKAATAMQTEVTRQGGDPEDDGTALAGAHRMFLNLKSAVTGQDDKAIVDEVERGEDHIKAKFEDALQDTDLSPETRSAIGAAWDSVKQGHDQMRDLKHAMERGN